MKSNNSTNYLPTVYEKSKDSLYSHTVFQVLSGLIKNRVQDVRILDLGCADKRSSRLLTTYGVIISEYCGVDHNSLFFPDIRADVRDLSFYYDRISFRPNMILLTDVLEHLEDGAQDIRKFLEELSSKLDSDTYVCISAPQMYRLDRFKLSHLSYPEHKVRMTLDEWENLIAQKFMIEEIVGIGYISVLPYIIMFLPFYNENGWTGSFFRKIRSFLSKSIIFRKFDHFLSLSFRGSHLLCQFSNSALFVCRKREDRFE